MDIKNFKPGQDAYIILEDHGRNTDRVIQKVKIVSIGKKYVKASPVGYRYTTDFFNLNDEEYLTENKDWGFPLKLFPSKQDADDYVERVETYGELRNKFQRYGMYDFTLDQLRRIKNIFDENLR